MTLFSQLHCQNKITELLPKINMRVRLLFIEIGFLIGYLLRPSTASCDFIEIDDNGDSDLNTIPSGFESYAFYTVDIVHDSTFCPQDQELFTFSNDTHPLLTVSVADNQLNLQISSKLIKVNTIKDFGSSQCNLPTSICCWDIHR